MQIRTLPNGDIVVTNTRHERADLRTTLHAIQARAKEAADVHERMADIEEDSDAAADSYAQAEEQIDCAIRFSRHEAAIGSRRRG